MGVNSEAFRILTRCVAAEAGAVSGVSCPEDPETDDEPVRIPITGELDLHTFRPNEIGDLLPDYFAECLAAKIRSVRVVHGKGSGALRTGVHRLLERLPMVASWTWPAGEGSGGWGATWVYLRDPQ